MNTATAMEQAGQRLEQSQGVVADTTRVFGYSGGVTHLIMDASDSGLKFNPIPGGTLLPFMTPEKHGYRGLFDDLKGKNPQHYLTKTPSDNAWTVEREFRVKKDQGYRTLTPLKPLPHGFNQGVYTDQAFRYFDILHPEITNCPFDLEKDVRFENDAFAYIACPMCRLAELKSDACSQRIFDAGANGFDTQVLADTRAVLIDACETAIRYTTATVSELEMDMKKRLSGDHGRTTRHEVDLVHLRQLHRNVPVEDTASGINQFANALTQAMQSNGAVDPNVAAKLELARLENENLKLQAQINQPTTADAPPTVTVTTLPSETPVDLTSIDVDAEVYIDGQPAIVMRKFYGKYECKLADGTLQIFKRDQLVPKEEYVECV